MGSGQPFSTSGCHLIFFILVSRTMGNCLLFCTSKFLKAIRIVPDQKPHSAASGLSLHHLHSSSKQAPKF